MHIVPAMKGISQAPKGYRSQMDTLELTKAGVEVWERPPFQRPLRVNAKVQALAEEIKVNGGVIPGIITLGVLNRKRYIIDGQHRIEAFKLSNVPLGYADVRLIDFETMGEMGEEFVKLNSALVRLRPDDILRGLEASHTGMLYLRRKCTFVGYDYIRRGPSSPIVSMSLILRAWFGSEPEVPASGTGGSAMEMSKRLTEDEAERMVEFLNLVYEAWGKDKEYESLWKGLSMTMTIWLYRRTVLSQYSPNTIRLTKAQFQKGLMAMSASGKFLDWLVGRQLCDRDRSPGYFRMKLIFTERLQEEFTGKKVRLPSPAWSHQGGAHSNMGLVK